MVSAPSVTSTLTSSGFRPGSSARTWSWPSSSLILIAGHPSSRIARSVTEKVPKGPIHFLTEAAHQNEGAAGIPVSPTPKRLSSLVCEGFLFYFLFVLHFGIECKHKTSSFQFRSNSYFTSLLSGD